MRNPDYATNAALCAAFFPTGDHNHHRRCRIALNIHNGARTADEIDPPEPAPAPAPRIAQKKARKARASA